MLSIDSGESVIRVRSRLMGLLGEQLITDETAALSELVKNSYDADSKKVIIKLNNVSSKEDGEIIITDDGNGMSKETLLKAWLELGSITKGGLKKSDRFSKILHRPYLGEKGLGRLSVHKIGKVVELFTREEGADYESYLRIDWSKFEEMEQFLEDVKIEWSTNKPNVITKMNSGFEKGTQIKISNIHRNWTEQMIGEIKQFVNTTKSPISDLTNFDITMDVNDKLDVHIKKVDFNEIFSTANYSCTIDVNAGGFADINYEYRSSAYSDFIRSEKFKNIDLKLSDADFDKKKPTCGPFKFVIYCWDLDTKDKKTSFDENITYEKSVSPFSGIKLFRDGFRVLPYGTKDNDWLNMDKRRVSRFQENVSRNQVIGFIEISSENNPKLIDKSDREGLISNDVFRDFYKIVICALKAFQVERNKERLKIKDVKREDVRIKKLKAKFSKIELILEKENVSKVSREKIHENVFQIQNEISNVIDDAEEPLLVAASIGLTYMIPTHEAERDIQESYKVLTRILKKKELEPNKKIQIIIEQLQHAEDILQGVVKISQDSKKERFYIKESMDFAVKLMRQKMRRNEISIETDIKIKKSVVGASRLFSIILLNLIDNSIFWLNKKQKDKKIKITFSEYSKKFYCLIVSDSGPGINDDIDFLSRPFVTRKSKGMGLGLYICDRIAVMHKGKLISINEFEFPGLLSGANIAILIPKID